MIRESFTVTSALKEEMIDITDRVASIVSRSNADGACVIYTPHTTAGITINENADPSVAKDIIKGLGHLALEKVAYAHMEGNSPAHIKSSLIGCSETVLVEKGSMALGRWQGIFFCEFDGPRNRKVLVRIL